MKTRHKPKPSYRLTEHGQNRSTADLDPLTREMVEEVYRKATVALTDADVYFVLAARRFKAKGTPFGKVFPSLADMGATLGLPDSELWDSHINLVLNGFMEALSGRRDSLSLRLCSPPKAPLT